MLLVGSGLLIRSYLQLQRVEPGFDPEGVATFSLSLPVSKYSAPEHLRAFVSTLLSRLEAAPGVQTAAVAIGLPFSSGLDAITGFRREDQPEPDSASMPSASLRIVSADYFRTMRIPILAGRPFDRRDIATSSEVASSTNEPHRGSSRDSIRLDNGFGSVRGSRVARVTAPRRW